MEKQICKLCKKEKHLRCSHIIPKFIFNYLKDSSATGYLRDLSSINRREQDGFKIPLLCRDCEQILSNLERKFSTDIFIPFQRKKGITIEYSSYLLKFAVSLSWRVLIYLLKDDDMADYDFRIKENINRCLLVWGDFLLDKSPHPSEFEQHLIAFDTVTSYSFPSAPVPINTYLSRTVHINFLYSETEAVVYTKICNFLLIGFVRVIERKLWKGTKIHVKSGTVGGRDIAIPEWLFRYIFDSSKDIQEQYDTSISKKQSVHIINSLNKNIECAFNSETLKARYVVRMISMSKKI